MTDQELRLELIKLAVSQKGSLGSEQIIDTAKEYYDYVTEKSPQPTEKNIKKVAAK